MVVKDTDMCLQTASHEKFTWTMGHVLRSVKLYFVKAVGLHGRHLACVINIVDVGCTIEMFSKEVTD